MTAPSATSTGAADAEVQASSGSGGPRDPDLGLARVHLLLGSLSLARTELEIFAGRGGIDDEGIRDLAEARWRTGDVSGAGEAARAWLEGHPDDILGLVIAAEAQAALGRPGEARRLAGRAVENADGSLDPIFAGMPRSPSWPVEPGTASGPVGVLFDDLHPSPLAVQRLAMVRSNGGAEASGGRTGDGPRDPFEPGVPAILTSGPSLWGDDATGLDAALVDGLDPTTLFHRAQVALDGGHAGDAATGLILALRASPALAPAILDLLAGRSESILTLVRGDAKRVVGRELEALRDHAAAAEALTAADDGPFAPSTGPDGAAPGSAIEQPADPTPIPPDLEDS